MSHRYPLTQNDFEDATRVIQRLIEFRDREQPPTSFLDRSAHLRDTIKTLALACDFWAVPDPSPAPAPRQQPQGKRNRPRNRKGRA